MRSYRPSVARLLEVVDPGAGQRPAPPRDAMAGGQDGRKPCAFHPQRLPARLQRCPPDGAL